MAQSKVSELAKVSAMGMIGTAIEDFDFIAAGLASSIAWPYVFFPKGNFAADLLASLGAFLVSFVARPFGAFLFGHYGDRLGRKSSLVFTLLTMGVGVLIIAIVPGYAVLGLAAPILLFIARILQGLGYGGEWGSVTTWVVEHASTSKWRALWASIVPEGYAIGGLAAAVLTTLLLSIYGFKSFVDFYWRIPFYIGIVVILIGAFLRYTLMESPIFSKIFSERKVLSLPSLQVFKEKWTDVLKLAGINMIAQTPFYVAITVMITYISVALSLPRSFASFTTVIGEIVGGFLVIICGLLADIVGRKNLLIAIYAIAIIFSIPYILLVNTAVPSLVLLSQVILMGLAFGAVAVLSSYLSEYFDPKYRASGSGLAYQIGVLLGVLPQSLLIGYIVGTSKVNSIYIGIILAITAILSLVSLLLARETRGIKVG
ncbi:MFS transporter [Metallosphaera javensis (ex Sakai et al. 2022)]|uniref:MFS transporter n=1 Tax=Metallosphaera javensis (ex Sakai et al. 2022) TaxID=2775498 RepID=UPI002590781F